jgi:hypothetical protein
MAHSRMMQEGCLARTSVGITGKNDYRQERLSAAPVRGPSSSHGCRPARAGSPCLCVTAAQRPSEQALATRRRRRMGMCHRRGMCRGRGTHAEGARMPKGHPCRRGMGCRRGAAFAFDGELQVGLVLRPEHLRRAVRPAQHLKPGGSPKCQLNEEKMKKHYQSEFSSMITTRSPRFQLFSLKQTTYQQMSAGKRPCIKQ